MTDVIETSIPHKFSPIIKPNDEASEVMRAFMDELVRLLKPYPSWVESDGAPTASEPDRTLNYDFTNGDLYIRGNGSWKKLTP